MFVLRHPEIYKPMLAQMYLESFSFTVILVDVVVLQLFHNLFLEVNDAFVIRIEV